MLTRGSFIGVSIPAFCRFRQAHLVRNRLLIVPYSEGIGGPAHASCRSISAERARALCGDRRRHGDCLRRLRRDARAARKRQSRRAHPDPAGRGGTVALRGLPLAEGSHAMTRGHRRMHRLLWPVLAIVVALGFTMALVKRPPPDPPAQTEPNK